MRTDVCAGPPSTNFSTSRGGRARGPRDVPRGIGHTREGRTRRRRRDVDRTFLSNVDHKSSLEGRGGRTWSSRWSLELVAAATSPSVLLLLLRTGSSRGVATRSRGGYGGDEIALDAAGLGHRRAARDLRATGRARELPLKPKRRACAAERVTYGRYQSLRSPDGGSEAPRATACKADRIVEPISADFTRESLFEFQRNLLHRLAPAVLRRQRDATSSFHGVQRRRAFRVPGSRPTM